MKNRYQIDIHATAFADPKMHNETVKNLWRGFTLTCSTLTLNQGAENTFVLGSCEIPVLPDAGLARLRSQKRPVKFYG